MLAVVEHPWWSWQAPRGNQEAVGPCGELLLGTWYSNGLKPYYTLQDKNHPIQRPKSEIIELFLEGATSWEHTYVNNWSFMLPHAVFQSFCMCLHSADIYMCAPVRMSFKECTTYRLNWFLGVCVCVGGGGDLKLKELFCFCFVLNWHGAMS